jgi:hypothetical protein
LSQCETIALLLFLSNLYSFICGKHLWREYKRAAGIYVNLPEQAEMKLVQISLACWLQPVWCRSLVV